MKTARLPQISVFNRQRKIALDRAELEAFARRALPSCAREKGTGLTSLPQVDVILISDRRISELHRRFMQIAGPTDVITFQHGEIFISVETAQRQAEAFGTSLEHELRLYLVARIASPSRPRRLGYARARRRMRSAEEGVSGARLTGCGHP